MNERGAHPSGFRPDVGRNDIVIGPSAEHTPATHSGCAALHLLSWLRVGPVYGQLPAHPVGRHKPCPGLMVALTNACEPGWIFGVKLG